jgi:hypothetical protein
MIIILPSRIGIFYMKKLNTLVLDSQEAKKPKIAQKIADKLHEIDQKTDQNIQAVAQKSLEKEKAFAALSQSKFQELKTWYLSLSQVKKLVYALLAIPILSLLLILNVFLFPLLASLLPLLFLALNFIFVALKLGLFIIYISYKITKTIMGIYYSISRTLSSLRENETRRTMLKQAIYPKAMTELYQTELNLSPSYSLFTSNEIAEIKAKESWKKLELDLVFSEHFYEKIAQLDPTLDILSLKMALPSLKLKLLFSYFRFFLLGQYQLYRGLWRCKKEILTIWRAESKAALKKELELTGASIFTPQAIGAYESGKQLLLTGDFKLQAIGLEVIRLKPSENEAQGQPTDPIQIKLLLIGFVPWKSWSFGLKYPFANATLSHMKWEIELLVDFVKLKHHPDIIQGLVD